MDMIDFINTANNTSININKKIQNDQGAQRNKTQTNVILMNINKHFTFFNFMTRKNLCAQIQCNIIMRKVNPKSSDEESFMYSILKSLHQYDISCNPERSSNLRPYINKYNFTDITAKGFEINNPDISLTIIDEDKNILYRPSNIGNNKAQVVKLKDNRYAAIKPIKNKYINLKEILQSFSHQEITSIIMQKIVHNKCYDVCMNYC